MSIHRFSSCLFGLSSLWSSFFLLLLTLLFISAFLWLWLAGLLSFGLLFGLLVLSFLLLWLSFLLFGFLGGLWLWSLFFLLLTVLGLLLLGGLCRWFGRSGGLVGLLWGLCSGGRLLGLLSGLLGFLVWLLVCGNCCLRLGLGQFFIIVCNRGLSGFLMGFEKLSCLLSSLITLLIFV